MFGSAKLFCDVGDECGNLFVIQGKLECEHGLDVFVIGFNDPFQNDRGEFLGMILFHKCRVVERGSHEEIACLYPFAIGAMAGDAGLIGETAKLENLVFLRGKMDGKRDGKSES